MKTLKSSLRNSCALSDGPGLCGNRRPAKNHSPVSAGAMQSSVSLRTSFTARLTA
jgi:hypothetical protein